jgi:hypothetical protein
MMFITVYKILGVKIKQKECYDETLYNAFT